MSRTDIGDEGQRTREQRPHEGDDGGLNLERLRAAGQNLGNQLEEQMHKRPYVAVGAAAGVGFVLGSLLGTRLGQVLLAAGLGYVVKNALGGDFDIEHLEQSLEKLTGERENA